MAPAHRDGGGDVRRGGRGRGDEPLRGARHGYRHRAVHGTEDAHAVARGGVGARIGTWIDDAAAERGADVGVEQGGDAGRRGIAGEAQPKEAVVLGIEQARQVAVAVADARAEFLEISRRTRGVTDGAPRAGALLALTPCAPLSEPA
jgi:hypothetical protein